MKAKIGINGFGRIGRQVFRAIRERHGDALEVVAINDLVAPDTNASLLKFDSSYGRYPGEVAVEGGDLVVDGKRVRVFAEKDPGKIPWKEAGVDIVIESTGLFTDAAGDPAKGKPGARLHIEQGGAKKVILSAPAKNEDLTIVLGVNEGRYDPKAHHVISNASCTTNCLAPVAKIVHDNFRILLGAMTTIHSYTNDQMILDQGHRKDLRRSRAAALNLIPTTTGAARAIGLVLPELKGKLDGFSMRVPTPTVSAVDLVVTVERPTTKKELVSIFEEAAHSSMLGILGVTHGGSGDPLVSMDFKGDSRSSIVDLPTSMVLGGNLIKVVAWYDNEWGYSCRVADLAKMVAERF